jgi:hypothetical protein
LQTSNVKVLSKRQLIFSKIMDKRDGMVLAAILIGVGIPVTLMFLVAEGVISTPFK